MSKNTSFLKLKNVSKFYYNKGLVASGFTKVNLEFNLGEFVVITGESGSGKSTLLNVLSGLDTYEEGELYINGEETSHYGEAEFEYYRKTYIGNIFQTFNLVNSYTVYQNIELVLLLNGYKRKDIKEKIIDLIKQVDLYKYRNTKVSKLSGGQKQRVAIARALAKNTPIIIADEPTGNLDSRSAESVIKTLSEVAKDKLVIIVTHNYEQVEKYATRKIEMHDGKVREDITITKTKPSEVTVTDYGDIDFSNKLRLGVRNTFNIFTKFALLFIVFLFVVSAFLLAYGSFKNAEYEELALGNNNFFRESTFRRIVVNKKDLSSFSDDELTAIKSINNVKKVYENDYSLDVDIYMTDDVSSNYWGTIKPLSLIDQVNIGRLPEKNDEVVLLLSYWDDLDEGVIGNKFTVYSTSNTLIKSDLEVVGIIKRNDYVLNPALYVTDDLITELSAKLIVDQAVDVQINGSGDYFFPKVNSRLTPGNIYVYDTISYCYMEECKNKTINIKVIDEYYEDDSNLKIISTITKKNSQALVNEEYKEDGSPTIYFSEEDYNKLFNHGVKQISVFVEDELKVDETKKELLDKGYNVLSMKDANYNYQEQILGVIRIIKMIVLIGLYVVLFFISYFVIKLIENSKNVYYATVRILGASRKVIKNLITIELLTAYHITYILFAVFVYLNQKYILNIKFVQENAVFLQFKDYILIYVLLLIMSYLISYRYARKLFKSSAMKAYREEV